MTPLGEDKGELTVMAPPSDDNPPTTDAPVIEQATTRAGLWASRASQRRGQRAALVIAAPVLLVLPSVIAYLFSASQSASYAAQADLVVEATSAGDSETQVSTLLNLLSSRTLLEVVADNNGLTTEELGQSVETEQLDASNVLRLTVTAADAENAQAIADDLIAEYLNLLRSLRGGSEELRLLGERAAEAASRQADVRARLIAIATSNAPADVEEARQLQLESDLLQQRISELQRTIIQTETSTATAARAVRSLGSAYSLDAPVGPQPLRAAAVGLVVGIVLTAALGTQLWRRQRT